METQQNNMAGNSMQKNKLMALLSYLGPLIIVSYISAKDDPFVKFHIKQGLTLLVLEIVVWFLMSFLLLLWPIWQLVHFGVIVLAILGIVNAAQGREKMLPVIGKFADKFNI